MIIEETTSLLPFLFMADSHIKARTWTNSSLLTGDAYEALGALGADVTASGGPGTLVIGGDWFDGQRPLSTDLLATKGFMERFSRVLYVRGNHDRNEPSYLDTELGGVPVTHLHGHMLREGSAALAGVDWQPSADGLKMLIGECLAEASAAGIATLYLVLHTSFRHLLSYDGAFQLSIEDIDGMVPDGMYAVVLAGDIHTINVTQGSRCTVVSVGSLYPLSSDRMHDDTYCGAAVVSAGGVEMRPHPVRHYRTVRYLDNMHLAEDCMRIADEFSGDPLSPFVSVDMPPDAVADVRPSLFPGVVMQVSLQRPDEERAAAIAQAASGYTMQAAISEEAGDDAGTCGLAQSLWASADPVADISGWLDGWGVERLA